VQVLNYVSLHVGSDSEGQDKLDSIRVSASKSSPMMETVNLVKIVVNFAYIISFL
jgi:proteasome component ECM29